MSTAPYAPDAEERIRFSARHTITATAYPNGGGSPITLDVEDASVEFDDSRAPRIQATLTCKIPADPATLELLDARKTFRIKILAGYVYDSLTEDIQLLADLHVRSREVRRPSNRVVFQCTSDEALMQDRKKMAWDSQPPQSNLKAALEYHIAAASVGGTAPPVVSDYDDLFGASAVSGLVQEAGQDSWSMVNESAARAGVSIFCEPDRTWRIAKPQTLSSDTALNLTTGGGGIIIESNSVYSRESFHNAVCIKYAWKDSGGVDRVLYGHAYVSTGDFALTSIGYNTYYEERDKPATQAQADAAATAVLKALARRGRSFTLHAVSSYWLRPGNTVTATLPEGEQERLLVSAVHFNFPSGSMQVRLRQPEDITISNT